MEVWKGKIEEDERERKEIGEKRRKGEGKGGRGKERKNN